MRDSTEDVKTKALSYKDYLMIDELLSLQNSVSSVHDELMFVVTHQTSELWFKVILYELEEVRRLMSSGSLVEATRLLNRVVQIEKVLTQQLHILETMNPTDFLRFRDLLGRSSGIQSIQFREIEFLAGLKDERFLTSLLDHEDYERLRNRYDSPSIWDTFRSLLFREGFLTEVSNVKSTKKKASDRFKKDARAVTELYNLGRPFELIVLSEALISFDEYFWLWRCHHIALVARIIGEKCGTGVYDLKELTGSVSSGLAYLKSTASKRFFPALWRARIAFQNPDTRT